MMGYAVDLIRKRRDGLPLSKDELYYLLKGYADGKVPDYQISAYFMAAQLSGINEEEQQLLQQVLKEVAQLERVDLNKLRPKNQWICKKIAGERLEKNEIKQLIQAYMKKESDIPDYEMAAWLMAVYFHGMDKEELADFTNSLVDTGEKLDLSAINGVVVDKHSTGGVGDKTTLILGPLLAAVGVHVAKMSGRGLGHTGGTLDKLDAIPSVQPTAKFNTALSLDEFISLVNKQKVAVAGQTADLAPGDKKLYALRDVTGTVESIPLIAASVMSKKLASGAQAIVLDVKVGSGAFMKTEQEALSLAKKMVKIGTHLGRRTIAVVTDMDQPLGYAIGNALEVQEAIEILQNQGPDDLREVVLVLGVEMMCLAKDVTPEQARNELERALSSGAALQKFKDWVLSQGGDPSVVDGALPQAKFQQVVQAKQDGFIQSIQTEEIGFCTMKLGAGREVMEDQIDPAVGIIMHVKIGQRVEKGDVLFTLHYNESQRLIEAKELDLDRLITLSNVKIERPKLIKGVIMQ
ncbi:pyrimidine-nucleoside phosphorylase [Seinonella peptonophila]|uniref:Pyrimidine-nucleoside phosphorylase n=1 Tax=Seinonella peptonophila TaxID=112248 RepID=A0A1M5A5B2_9BACL|nr:thymidine phosphorylase [Seinonella peptonophila]SHF25480.1 pyrimidine-nucleoside phosphorylase [Seinonella peptonophila]